MRLLSQPHLFCEYHRSDSERREYRHSSTTYPLLTTTTFQMLGERYCIHCGDKAFALQAGIESHMGGNYSTTGYRCTCDDAMKELAVNMAINLMDCPVAKQVALAHYKIPQKGTQPPSDFLKAIVNKEKDLRVRDLICDSNGHVYRCEADPDVFTREEMKDARSGSQFSDQQLSAFVSSVDGFVIEIMGLRVQHFEKEKGTILKRWGLNLV